MPVYAFILGLGLFGLPFTKALTLDIGFPLKIYEILFLATVPAFLLSQSRIEFGRVAALYRPLIAFWLIAVFAFFSFAYADLNYGALAFRGGPVLDGFARTSYLLLNLLVFVVITARPHLHLSGFFTGCWLWGMAFSALYTIYCAISLTIWGDAILLPGLERHQPGSIGPITLSRSGTFDEGNFAGLYFLLSIFLALREGKAIFALLALIGLIFTASTAAYFGLVIAIAAFTLLSTKSRILYIPYLLVGTISLMGVFLYFSSQGKFEASANSSGGVRLNEAMTGINIWLTQPIYGVGLGQYGFNYFNYIWDARLVSAVSERHIVNNVYVEILAELGIIGVIAFYLFWRRWTKIIKLQIGNEKLIYASTLSILVAFFAYPTFNIAFLWCYFALAALICTQPGTIFERRTPRLPRPVGQPAVQAVRR